MISDNSVIWGIIVRNDVFCGITDDLDKLKGDVAHDFLDMNSFKRWLTYTDMRLFSLISV